jgi:hypothetical protein
LHPIKFVQKSHKSREETSPKQVQGTQFKITTNHKSSFHQCQVYFTSMQKRANTIKD